MEQIRVMSMNLRVDTDKDGINAFPYRKDEILRMLQEEHPDIIGFQEARDAMRRDLVEHLSDYVVVGAGRNKDNAGEGVPVAFLKSEFELISMQSRWLSLTPTVAGTMYGGDHSHCPRMYLRLCLRHISSGALLTMVNVHTDHMGSNARLMEVTQLIEDLQNAKGESLIITGDFNARPHKPEILHMTQADPTLGLQDATKDVLSSFHGFGTKQEDVKIDYIFTNLPYSNSHAIERVPVNGVYLSDHHPIVTALILPQKD